MNVKLRSQTGRDYFWNTAASVMTSASTVLLLLVVTQFLGAYVGGVFSFAFALAQQFQTVGTYDMRSYQATDVQDRFTFGTYHASRIVTTGLMMAGVSGYALVTNGWTSQSLLIILVACLRFFDAFEDVFHGEFQRLGRLDIAGRAFFFRVLTTTVAFTAAIAVSRSLMISCIITIAVSTAALIGLNVPMGRRMFRLRPTFNVVSLRSLLLACLPLACGAFLAMYLVNGPKFGIERNLSPEYQTYYAVLFMPALVINLLSTFIFKPLLTTLAKAWVIGDRRAFTRLIKNGLIGVGAATVVTFIAAYLFGLPILEALYGVDLSGYRPELLALVLGGAFNAVGYILYYAMVTMRHQRLVMVGYAAAAIVVTVLCTMLIPSMALMGACIAYDIAMATLACFFGTCCLLTARSR